MEGGHVADWRGSKVEDMKPTIMYEVHVPVEQYGFIAAHVESQEPEDAIAAYHSLKKAFQGGEGIGMKELARIIHEYCLKGSITNGADYQDRYSQNEMLLLNEVKKLIRNSQK